MTKVLCAAVMSMVLVVPSVLAGTTQVKQFDIGFIDPEVVQSVVRGIQSEEGKVVYDPRTNTLIVIDTPQNLEYISKVIEELDRKVKMVKIDVTIVDASEKLVRDIGLGTGYLVLPEGSFGVVADMIESGKEASVRTKSTVSTLSNHPAQIQVTQDVAWGHEHVIYYPHGHEEVFPLVEPVGSTLEVVPTVYSDNSIKLRIHPSLSTVDGSGALPVERSLSTEVIMNSGDTVALGGVESQGQTTSGQTTLFGIPLSRKKESNKSKVVMFLTAEVLD